MTNSKRFLFAAVVAGGVVALKYQISFLLSDVLLGTPTVHAATLASTVSPQDEAAYQSLLQLDPEREHQYALKAVAANPRDSSLLANLGLYEEAAGNDGQAESYLLQAHAVDSRPATSWALTNFYARRQDLSNFALWGRRYLQLQPADAAGFFRLAWEMNPDADEIQKTFGPLTCDQLDKLAGTMQIEGASEASIEVEKKEAACATGEDLKSIERFTSTLLNQDRSAAAAELWHQLAPNHAFTLAPKGENLLSNADFGTDLTELGFDWVINRSGGIESRQIPQQHAVEFNLSGEQAEHATVLYQPVVLEGGRSYAVHSRFIAAEDDAFTCLRWRIVELTTGRTLVVSPEPRQESISAREVDWTFQAPQSPHSLVLALSCDRREGNPNPYGIVSLVNASLTEQK